MIAVILAFFSAIAAELGGLLALSNTKRLGTMLGFTAGALVGLVAFDLLPEIFEGVNRLDMDVSWSMIALVCGFLLFHTVEKFILIHNSHEGEYVIHSHPHVGVAGAVALSGHSLLDGISIGLAFEVNSSVGLAVAIAVIGHRFADGFNGVNLMLKHQNKPQLAKKVLIFIAIAPIIGALLTQFITVSTNVLVIYLGFFAGFLLYIGASDILPQAHSKGSSKRTIMATIVGAAFMFGLTRLL